MNILERFIYLFTIVLFMYPTVLCFYGMHDELTKRRFFFVSFCFCCAILSLISVLGTKIVLNK
jgi:hypothetical protein